MVCYKGWPLSAIVWIRRCGVRFLSSEANETKR